MEDAKQTTRPRYGMGQNVLYMLRTAWRTRKSVIALCAAQALLGVASAAVGMFFAPAALGAIETGAPLARLLGIIGAFSCALLLLGALAAYASANTEFGRIQVRMELFYRTMLKSATTALANAENPAFQEKSAKANAAMNSNAAAARGRLGYAAPDSGKRAGVPSISFAAHRARSVARSRNAGDQRGGLFQRPSHPGLGLPPPPRGRKAPQADGLRPEPGKEYCPGQRPAHFRHAALD